MTQYSGKIIRKNPVVPTQTSASGVWTTTQAAAAVKNNTWPVPGVPSPISRSVRFRSSASAYFSRTPSVVGNQKTWTFSAWVKRGTLSATGWLLGAGTATDYTGVFFTANNNLQVNCNTSSTQRITITSVSAFRDPSAWYHVVAAIDTTQATNSNGVKIYVNGVQQTLTYTVYTQNVSTAINNTVAQALGQVINVEYFDGYMTEINLIDGQALTPSSFGTTDATTGAWIPMPYTGTYGTNGFYLNFKDNSSTGALGLDYSGNGNSWTANNISLTAGTTYDSMVDVPTLWMPYNTSGDTGALVRGNYCVVNPTNNTYSTGSGPKYFTLTNGNLTATTSAGGGGSRVLGTIGVSSGKWYAEATIGAASINASADQGLICVPVIYQASSIGGGSGGVVYIAGTGQKRTDASGYAAYGSTYTTGDVIGIALDMDAGTVTFYKNNVSQGVALSGLTGSYTVGAQANDVSSNANYATYEFNFGQRPFTYTPPIGFKSLNTFNLPASTISNGASYMAATLYTGNGATQSISNTVNGISFQPDFVWLKARSGVFNNVLQDTVRGITNYLVSDLTSAEGSGGSVTVTAVNSNGFSLGSGSSWNNNATTFVGWQWKAGGTPAVTNTNGSITSSVSAGTTQGFSVVTYTGNGTGTPTIGHGLGVAPAMIIAKTRSTANGWLVYHQSLGATKSIILNGTNAASTQTDWGNTTPTSAVFYVNGGNNNISAATYVAYCFAEVAGFSKFGSYTGNGSADGTFVYCGFRPRFVMVKRTDTTSNWIIKDTGRSTYNTALETLYPNLSNAEGSGDDMDILSNGFKMKLAASTNLNASGGTYIFAAFAELPFKNSNAR